MKRLGQKFPVEKLGRQDGEPAIDSQIEVDLICGGVGFDDGPTSDDQWLKEAIKKRKAKANKKEA